MKVDDGLKKFKVKVKSLSRVRLFPTPWTIAHQAPLFMGFSRQEYWSGLPFPSPEDIPNPGIEPRSPTLQADALTSEPPLAQRKSLKSHRNRWHYSLLPGSRTPALVCYTVPVTRDFCSWYRIFFLKAIFWSHL